MGRLMKDDLENLKIGRSKLFALIHLCLVITLIFSPLYFFDEFIKELSIFPQVFFILIFGIAGFGLYLSMYPHLREAEKTYILLEENNEI